MQLTDFAVKPIPTQPGSQLLSLSAELRLRIYSQIMMDPGDPVKIIETSRPGASQSILLLVPHPFARTSRLLTKEFEEMYQAALSWHRVRTTSGPISVYVYNLHFPFLREVWSGMDWLALSLSQKRTNANRLLLVEVRFDGS